MAFRVEITRTAMNDANEILEWLLFEHAGEAGLRWFRRLEQAIASLSSFPARCNLAPENTSTLANCGNSYMATSRTFTGSYLLSRVTRSESCGSATVDACTSADSIWAA